LIGKLGLRADGGVAEIPPVGRDWAEEEMKSYDPDPNLPDDVSIDLVRFPHRIKWALVAAGLKTVGDVRGTSDSTLLGTQNLGQISVSACEMN
jgi:DNA-directed RNA polymerase alpha subunit